jgi:hypothetical protein
MFLIPLPSRPVLPGMFQVPLKAPSEFCPDSQESKNRAGPTENGSENQKPSRKPVSGGQDTVGMDGSRFHG